LPFAGPRRDDPVVSAVGRGEVALAPGLRRRVFVEEPPQLGPKGFFLRPPGQLHDSFSSRVCDGGVMLRDRAPAAASPLLPRISYGRLMRLRTAVAGSVAGAGVYLGVATGRVSVDLGVGRRKRALGPIDVEIAAPREILFDVISDPYLGRTPRAMAGKLRVIERGSDLVLAEHMTPIGAGLTAITVETVRFVPPERVEFRLVRGPVPSVS